MSNYAVVDLEMCKVPRAKRTDEYPYRNEIIQVGVILLDDKFDIVDEFKSYVSPDNGVVDTYIQNLTGITAENVANAPKLADVLSQLVKWLPDDTIMIEWSDNDEKQLRLEIEAKQLPEIKFEVLLREWVDCQKLFGDKLGTDKVYRLSEALNISDICYDDGAHDALVDARNTARLFRKIKTEVELKLNPYYVVNERPFDSGISLGALLAGLAI